MDTRQVYEKLMLEHFFNKMKRLRNEWSETTGDNKTGLISFIDIAGLDQRRYKVIMESCNEYIYEMLPFIVAELLRAYEIPVQFYDLRCSGADLYYIGDNQQLLDYIDQHDEKRILAFSRKDKQQEILYVFKKYGIGKRVPGKTIEGLLKAAKLEKYCYISYVENDAFTEVINHNDNEKDPTRGTGIFSLKQFFDDFFGESEYVIFKEYADELTKKVREYFGFELIRTLKPNTMHSFRKSARDDILSLDARKAGLSSDISETQRQIMEEHFFKDKRYEVLLGSCDFAQSYLTAEWLFSSLSNAGNIDMTAIAMGYFKAIEQLLFSFIKLHTFEKDGINRTVHVGNKTYADSQGNADLTDGFVSDQEKTKDLTLGNLTGFLGYHDVRRGRYYRRNRDLLVRGIDTKTYDSIIDTLDGVVGLRNGYFHKDNLDDWNKVIDARNTARLVFFILLGSYKISETDMQSLGRIKVEDHDDFYKLCEYINQKAYDGEMFTKPIFYFGDINDPYDFGVPKPDDYIEFDIYGEPIYSGIYFSRVGDKNWTKKMTKDDLPAEIWEGVFTISQNIPISFEPSGAQKKIFSDGKFITD